MLSIVIVGTGNVATHLFNAFTKSEEVKVVQVVGRNQNSLEEFSKISPTSKDFTQITTADVYIIAVRDDAITEVSQFLVDKKGIVVHTSGAEEMDGIATKNRGVFYPLQTFTIDEALDFKSVPICIEAKQDSALKMLQVLGEVISEKVYELTSDQRKKMHLAAVFANNFTNHLYSISESICQQEGLSFELLQPLILETAKKVQSISPKDAQTGPAKRGDKKTIESHLKLLKDKKQTELYTLFSEAIKKMYEEKL